MPQQHRIAYRKRKDTKRQKKKKKKKNTAGLYFDFGSFSSFTNRGALRFEVALLAWPRDL
jgi:hypothetical protein